MTCNVCGEVVDLRQAPQWKDGFELLRCQRCGLLFRRILPSRADLADLYTTEYFHDEIGETGGYADYLADESLHRSLARRRLGTIEGALPGLGRLLDVGTAAGFFVAEAIARGWDARGVDVSHAMVDCAVERLGVPVLLGGLEDVEAEQFDAITMWDYVEHSLDPAADITLAASLLRTGGILAISTGDADSFVARLSGSRWHLLTPRHHNFFFSTSTIRRLLESRGFDVLDMSRPGARYSVSHLLYKLGRLAPGASRWRRLLERTARSRLGALSVPVNLYDIVTVLARRQTSVAG